MKLPRLVSDRDSEQQISGVKAKVWTRDSDPDLTMSLRAEEAVYEKIHAAR